MDVGVPRAGDNRRLEVVVDGLLLYNGRQLAVDTTLVSTLKGNGGTQERCSRPRWVALAEARRVKERTNPELVGPGARPQLVVLALEVGGRWSEEAKIFIRLLARARFMQRRLEQAWRPRWYAIITCAAARAFAASLLGLRGGRGSDGQVPPSHEVERDHAIALRDCLSPKKKKKHISKHQHPHIAHQHTNTHTGNVSFVVTDFNFFELIRLCSHSFFPNYFCISVLWEDASKRYRTTFTHCLVITSSQTKCVCLLGRGSLYDERRFS